MVGNRVFANALILAAAIALVFLQCGTVVVSRELFESHPDMFRSSPKERKIDAFQFKLDGPVADAIEFWFVKLLEGQTFPIDGRNGTVYVGSLRIPFWSIALGVGLGAVMAALNLMNLTQLPQVIVPCCFGLSLGLAGIAAHWLAAFGSVGLGAVLAVAAPGCGLLLSLWPMERRRRRFLGGTVSTGLGPQSVASEARTESTSAWQGRHWQGCQVQCPHAQFCDGIRRARLLGTVAPRLPANRVAGVG